MSITGGIKFFEPNMTLAVNGGSITASTGQVATPYAIDRNNFTYWRSVSSNDTITETLEVDFPSMITIDRLLFLDINWKGFTVKYDVAGTWTNFASVIGIDGGISTITETAFADNTAYYEFTQVTTGKILISITTTQTANQEKYVSQIIATKEIGTLLGFPMVKASALSRNPRVQKTVSGRFLVQKSDDVTSFQVDFKNYPPAAFYAGDLDLMMTLFDRDQPFIVWLCGGRRGSKYFNYTIRGFRLLDALTMQLTKDYTISYNLGVYILGINNSIDLSEHI